MRRQHLYARCCAAGAPGSAAAAPDGAYRSPAMATLYESAGGMPFFERLVDRFYDGVASDPLLLPLYPEQPDLTGARRRLTLFLAQYCAGPQPSSQDRAQPPLRMRHLPFSVGPYPGQAWLIPL